MICFWAVFLCLTGIANVLQVVAGSNHLNCTFFTPADPFPRIMVTGGAGFIGSSLVKRLKFLAYPSVKIVGGYTAHRNLNLIGTGGSTVIDEHHDICTGDLTDAQFTRHVFRNVDWVIHLADAANANHKMGDDHSLLFRENVLINTNVIRAASHHNASKFIYVGTARSLPQKMRDSTTGEEPAALDEKQIYPANPESPYGWSKLIGEYELTLIEELNYSTLRLHYVYGPGAGYADPKNSQGLSALIRKAINSPSETFNDTDNGKQFRDFVFIDDVVDALVASLKRDSFKGAVQIGTGVGTKFQEAAAIIAKLTSKCLSKELKTTPKIENADGGNVAVIRRAQKLLSWTPKVSISHGISMSYAWILRDMALTSDKNATLLQYALCIDKESEEEKKRGWTPPVHQAKGYKVVLPAPPGDISAVIPNFYCENERQRILKELEKTPPPRKTLVVIQSSTRAGHVTYDSLKGNVLNHLDADLALSVEAQEFPTFDAFRSNAKYVWELNPPANGNYGNFFNEIAMNCFNHPFDWNYAHAMGHLNKHTNSGWLGCIDGTDQVACAGLIIFYRWFALQNIIKHKLYEKYDTVIVSRSDQLWMAPYDNSTFPAERGVIYVPNGNDWGGLMDRHYHMSMYDAINTLGMADIVVERKNSADQVKFLIKNGFDSVQNMERAHLLWHTKMKKMRAVRFKTTCMLVGDSSDSSLQRWSIPHSMKYHGIYLNIKYENEFQLLKDTGVI